MFSRNNFQEVFKPISKRHIFARFAIAIKQIVLRRKFRGDMCKDVCEVVLSITFILKSKSHFNF